MRRLVFVLAVAAAFVAGYFFGCGDELLPAATVSRYVHEVSEANVTGNGGVVNVPEIKVGQTGDGGADMPAVIVYGSGYAGNNHWKSLSDFEVYEGKVRINTNEWPSYYYRVVVIW